MLSITGLPAFNDNYIWMLADSESQTCYVVDPGDAQVVERACQEQQLTLAGILVTHHHADHIGGVNALTKDRSIPMFGPAHDNISVLTHPLSDGDTVNVFGGTFQVLDTPGHTKGHICYFGQPENIGPVLFCGDTLFAGGCGRLFEGTPAQMLSSLTRLSQLPEETRVYCAHEYTLSNLKFAHAVEPNNTEIAERIQQVQQLRRLGLPTVPSTIALEQKTNPFLRTALPAVQQAASRFSGRPVNSNEDSFAIIRQWKDNF
ncbi:hydroxyacylglutathione hydrolase [Parendozoicomonas haliclonae]|uniref:Hydroxyacylglutathione hydrolase n=1 Tax=Parendozoicomonas haliclonae TaxID=1960125 RepID=A0A1X7AME1_9GAMM|nr:hydroxyacylglutathione hydrolase [Parendozoicomonas haliclonae]SMA49135.1 Hydroxyacylglutathione hydrolase [Parendozoicomonas haliclonae]